METEIDPLRYDKWIEDALRGVVRRALSFVAREGLPGEHHFYITFRTSADGVVLPDHLRAQHPEEMTIVLQHQFWDLEVERTRFSVSLKFKGQTERLTVPLTAITAFADPAVNFGLQLKMVPVPEAGEAVDAALWEEEDAAEEDEADAAEPEKSGEIIALDTFRKK